MHRMPPGLRKNEVVARIWAAFVEHNLLTYAAAIAFQGLIAFVPLTLLALGVLGATGHRELWTQHVAPVLARSAHSRGLRRDRQHGAQDPRHT
jgi:uncharacterized BrkB/YihY/UPF0761 family membrane protein